MLGCVYSIQVNYWYSNFIMIKSKTDMVANQD